jgi:hypothetical protein
MEALLPVCRNLRCTTEARFRVLIADHGAGIADDAAARRALFRERAACTADPMDHR